jgi:hypothetical protein
VLRRLHGAKNAECAQRVPPARGAGGLVERHGQGFVVDAIEWPSSIGPALGFDDPDGVGDAFVVRAIRSHQIVERAQNVVVIARRKGEFKERRIGDLARRAPAEEVTLEEVVLGRRRAAVMRADGPATRSYSSSPSSTQIVV